MESVQSIAQYKHAIAILTYAPDQRFDARLKTTVDTLKASGYPGKIIVVDDGSGRDRDVDVDCLIYKGYNSGINRGKNTCIKHLLKRNLDIGFLADDDIEFSPRWWIPYLDAHLHTGIRHFSWVNDRIGYTETAIRGYPVKRAHGLNGCLLTFTPEVVDKIGYFIAAPTRWGFSHTIWTKAIVRAGLAPFYADVLNSNSLLRISREAGESTISIEERRQNRKYLKEVGGIGFYYQPLVE